MLTEVGQVEAIFRYPVKSMAGERLEAAELGWSGFVGDRRLALRRVNERGAFPWLTASKLPELIRYTPVRRDGDDTREQPTHPRIGGEPPSQIRADGLPTHIRTPEGAELPVFGEELAVEIGRRDGAPVEMMQMKHGVFDEAGVSVIAGDTVREIARLAGRELDVRRFRPNILVRLLRPGAFQEDEWVGGVLRFGEDEDAAAISVTLRDERCAMVNIDPDSASLAPEVMKAIVRERQNYAGVYATVTRVGRVAVGQRIWWEGKKG